MVNVMFTLVNLIAISIVMDIVLSNPRYNKSFAPWTKSKDTTTANQKISSVTSHTNKHFTSYSFEEKKSNHPNKFDAPQSKKLKLDNPEISTEDSSRSTKSPSNQYYNVNHESTNIASKQNSQKKNYAPWITKSDNNFSRHLDESLISGPTLSTIISNSKTVVRNYAPWTKSYLHKRLHYKSNDVDNKSRNLINNDDSSSVILKSPAIRKSYAPWIKATASSQLNNKRPENKVDLKLDSIDLSSLKKIKENTTGISIESASEIQSYNRLSTAKFNSTIKPNTENQEDSPSQSFVFNVKQSNTLKDQSKLEINKQIETKQNIPKENNFDTKKKYFTENPTDVEDINKKTTGKTNSKLKVLSDLLIQYFK